MKYIIPVVLVVFLSTGIFYVRSWHSCTNEGGNFKQTTWAYSCQGVD